MQIYIAIWEEFLFFFSLSGFMIGLEYYNVEKLTSFLQSHGLLIPPIPGPSM